ncbi:hypothetical protein [Mycobacterium kansasii]|uniref:hypothetical protein n=1 Tax=Mycobacterium kansasii TaxID=1768 RepID=UPI0012EC99CC|nr:hypothetical protein [Mycobacterium kansasii]
MSVFEYSNDRAPQPQNKAHARGSDSAPGHVRLTKSRRGTRAAGLALGALAITGGVTGVLDASSATTNGPTVTVGRLAITLTANHGFKLDTCTAGNSGIAQGDNTNSGNSSNIDSSEGTGANNGDTASDPIVISNSDTTSAVGGDLTNQVGVDVQEIPENIIASDLATDNVDIATADIGAELGNNNNNNNAPPPVGMMWPDGLPRWANLPPYDPNDPDDN